MVVGTPRTKKFRIYNNSFGTLNIHIDHATLRSNGFTWEPAKINKLAPKENMEVKISYQSRRSQPLGINKTVIPIGVRGGLTYNVVLQANLTIPDITISTELFDFG